MAVYLETSSVRPIHQFRHSAAVTAAAIDPSGRRVLTISDDATIHIWDTHTGDEIAQLKGHDNYITDASFSPDASRLISASEDGTAILWDMQTGELVGPALRHDDAVSASAFSPDGARLVTASRDGTARIWNAATGAQVAVLRGHTAMITAIAFSPDGRFLLTGSVDRTVRIWDASAGFIDHGDAVCTNVLASAAKRTSELRSGRIMRQRSGAPMDKLIEELRSKMAQCFSGGSRCHLADMLLAISTIIFSAIAAVLAASEDELHTPAFVTAVVAAVPGVLASIQRVIDVRGRTEWYYLKLARLKGLALEAEHDSKATPADIAKRFGGIELDMEERWRAIGRGGASDNSSG